MERKLNIGILGTASIAKKYTIEAFKTLENAGHLYVASRDKKKSELLASQFGIFTKDSYDALIADDEIHAVYIPLPIGLHTEWSLKAAYAKKHILCEKSLSPSLVETKKIISACKENNVVLFENFMCDYHPQHKKVLSLIMKREIGDIFTYKGYFGVPPFKKGDVRYSKTLGGGSLNDIGAYPVFMARKIFQSEPIFVTCYLEEDSSLGIDQRGSAFLEFPSNKTAFISCSSFMPAFSLNCRLTSFTMLELARETASIAWPAKRYGKNPPIKRPKRTKGS